MTRHKPLFRHAEAKLQHILLHSARTFAQHGFEATSMREISRATGVSLSGLYYYFDSKQRLLYQIQNHTFTFILERLQQRLQSSADPQARLRLLVQNHIEYFLTHPNEMKVLSHEEEALAEPLRREIGVIKRKYYALARKIFDQVEAEASCRQSARAIINPRIAVLSLFGMMNWVYQWHKPDIDPSADELTEAIVGIFLHGVVAAPPQGHHAKTPAISHGELGIVKFQTEFPAAVLSD